MSVIPKPTKGDSITKVNRASDRSSLRSERGKAIYYHQETGSLYRRGHKHADKMTVTWRCHQTGCTGAIYMTVAGEYKSTAKPCTHQPNRDQYAAKTALQGMKIQKLTGGSTAECVRTALATVPARHMGAMPKKASMAKSVQRLLKKSSETNAWPPDVKWDEFRFHPNGLPSSDIVVIYDSTTDTTTTDVLLIFATQDGIDNLNRSLMWAGDGDMKRAPKGFLQLYSIGAMEGHVYKSGAYALLEGKSERLYSTMLEKLKAVVMLQPLTFILDLETAFYNALQTHYPNCTPQFCLFHLKKNWWKWMSDHKLDEACQKDEDYHDAWKKLSALPFVIPQEVPQYFAAVQDLIQSDAKFDSLKKFTDYLVKYYIGGSDSTGTLHNPRFPIKYWNVYVCILLGGSATNNSAESFNSRLARTIRNLRHPTMSTLITALIKMEEEDRNELTLLESKGLDLLDVGREKVSSLITHYST